ncbi:hypothetical protein J2S31_002131 [Nitrospina gracilis Nb-211]|nr:hypothetical protein [Nitrospina gracilis Nb-211]
MSNQIMNHCKLCDKKTLHVGPSTSHVLHLLLTLLTMGVWVFMWILVAANNTTKTQCTVCGRNKGIFG